MPAKPYAASCDENRAPLLAVLRDRLRGAVEVLEIGSGTGQHAVYFAAALPWLRWQPSDRASEHAGMRLWLEEAALANVRPPLALDVLGDPWPGGPYDAVFSANTAHIMDLPAVAAMFAGVGRVLRPGGQFLLYGPFNRAGRYTSDSNARFDAWLKQRDPASGIRDIGWLNELAAAAGMVQAEEIGMPVNNLTLVWRKQQR